MDFNSNETNFIEKRSKKEAKKDLKSILVTDF